MTNCGLKLLTFICALVLMGCTQPPPSPTCRIAKAFNADYAGPAGCIIRVQDTLLVIKERSTGQYDLPFGDPISKESAQCTAHRNTWLQTGFNVEVDQLLGVTQSGIMLFSCALSAGFTSEDGPIKPPNWAHSDVQQIEFIGPFDTRYNVWSQPGNLIMYRDGFVAMKGE
ncbi:MAG: hypothetical protein ACJAYN_001036 [Bermanella sp.]|jgi:hypothetical protein